MKWVPNNIFTTWEKSPSHLERSGDLVPPNGDWFFIYLFCPWFIPSPRSDSEDALGQLDHCSRFWGLLPHFQSGRMFPAHGRRVGNRWSLMSLPTKLFRDCDTSYWYGGDKKHVEVLHSFSGWRMVLRQHGDMSPPPTLPGMASVPGTEDWCLEEEEFFL